MCAAQKNALDYLSVEWRGMATSFVSYGGVSGGLRSVQHAKAPITALGMVPTAAAVMIPMASGMVKDGAFSPSDMVADSVAPMLAELATLADVLTRLRQAARTS